MKPRNFVLTCSSRHFVLLLDALSNYRSVLEDSVVYLDKDPKEFDVLNDIQELQEKLNSLL